MLISKSFLVTGDTTNRDGRTHRNICENVDAVLNAFYAENPGKLVNLQTNLELGGQVGQDMVFLTVTLEVEIPDKSEPAAVKESSQKKVFKK